MILHKSSFRLTLIAGALLASVGCGGVRCQTDSFLRYHAKTDSFRCLQVYLDLRSEDAKELDQLKSLWDRRARLIINPLEPDIFGVTLFERKTRHELEPASVRFGGVESLLATSVDLDMITIVPGEFFLNDQRHLCFFQQAEIPGPVVDKLLEELSAWIASEISKKTLAMMREGAAQGQERMNWDDVRADLAVELFPQSKTRPPERMKGKLLPLDINSLVRLIKTRDIKSVQLSRSGSILKLFVPLSEHDAGEAIATVQFLRRNAGERMRAGKEVGLTPRFLDVMIPTVVQGEGLLISIEMTQWVKVCQGISGAPLSRAETRTCLSTVGEMEERGAQINRKFDFKRLLRKYEGR
ncbi:hypothetical protein BH10PLA2_BH10PLA2_29320 [soil metagenome]